MAFKVLAGPSLNSVGRAVADPVMDPVALTGFPATNLCDDRASLPAMFSTNQENSTIVFDLNLIAGGNGEDAGDADLWAMLGTGTITVGTNPYGSGAGNLIVEPVEYQAIAYQDVVVRAGEAMTIKGAVACSTGTASILIRNRQTGSWLDDTATWGSRTSDYAAAPAVVSQTDSGTYVPVSLDFVVESLTICQSDSVTLRLYLYVDNGSGGGEAGDFDEIELFPQTSWISVHGHNVPPFADIDLDYSNNGTSWTNETTIAPPPRDSFYYEPELYGIRFWRLTFKGIPDAGSLIYIGEVVIGQSFDLARNPLYGGSISWNDRQVRLESSIGDQYVHLHGHAPQRSLTFSFHFASEAEYDQFRREIFRGSRGGANLICVAPVEMDAEQVILGRIREMITVEKITHISRTSELEIVESPLPSVPNVVHVYDEPLSETGGV